MSSEANRYTLDRYTQINELAMSVRWLIKRSFPWLTAVLAIETSVLVLRHSPGAIAFGLISAGTLAVFAIWRSAGIGLPIVPILVLQHLVAYGLPIVIGHEVLEKYSPAQLTSAGIENLVFCLSLVGAWRLGMQVLYPASAYSYALRGFKEQGSERLRRVGFMLVGGTTAYAAAQNTPIFYTFFAMLPAGSSSVLTALAGAASACGFFLVSMFVGSKTLSAPGRVLFWSLLALNCLISAAGYLLSPATATLAAVLIGLFWSSGRVPWRFLIIVGVLMSFLNVGKYTMRDRYWNIGTEDEGAPSLTITQMPASYSEWAQVSFDVIMGREAKTGGLFGDKARNKGISLLERVNNLQNLLFVIEAMDTWNIPALGGKTYALIPPLLLPRILWPEKPRSHEGQVILNVHFGRQDLNSTYKTYVAWGLLPEAYGNFGPRLGAVLLGACFGIFFAWLENFTTRKLLLSLEGFASFMLLLVMANSYEMVASVLVTTLFQGIGVLVIACAPFVERTIVTRPKA